MSQSQLPNRIDQNEPAALGHQPEQVHTRFLLFTGVGVLVGIGVVLAAMAWLRSSMPGPIFQPTASPAPADLETIAQWCEPDPVLAQLRQREERLLTTYGWVDRDAGLVRIPIDEAMRLVAEGRTPRARDPQRTEQEGAR
jgi:hypothetical protein